MKKNVGMSRRRFLGAAGAGAAGLVGAGLMGSGVAHANGPVEEVKIGYAIIYDGTQLSNYIPRIDQFYKAVDEFNNYQSMTGLPVEGVDVNPYAPYPFSTHPQFYRLIEYPAGTWKLYYKFERDRLDDTNPNVAPSTAVGVRRQIEYLTSQGVVGIVCDGTSGGAGQANAVLADHLDICYCEISGSTESVNAATSTFLRTTTNAPAWGEALALGSGVPSTATNIYCLQRLSGSSGSTEDAFGAGFRVGLDNIFTNSNSPGGAFYRNDLVEKHKWNILQDFADSSGIVYIAAAWNTGELKRYVQAWYELLQDIAEADPDDLPLSYTYTPRPRTGDPEIIEISTLATPIFLIGGTVSNGGTGGWKSLPDINPEWVTYWQGQGISDPVTFYNTNCPGTHLICTQEDPPRLLPFPGVSLILNQGFGVEVGADESSKGFKAWAQNYIQSPNEYVTHYQPRTFDSAIMMCAAINELKQVGLDYTDGLNIREAMIDVGTRPAKKCYPNDVEKMLRLSIAKTDAVNYEGGAGPMDFNYLHTQAAYPDAEQVTVVMAAWYLEGTWPNAYAVKSFEYL